MKRRSFINKSLAGVGAMATLGCDFSKVTGQPNTNKLGVALVGLGYYSRDLLAPALQLTNHCELRGIVTGSPWKIPIWQEKYGIADKNVYNYENMSSIANNDDIDVIYIVLPTGMHSEYSVKAANAGKHVWCEKPMARTVQECKAIIEACQKNKVKLSIGYRMQHEPNTQTIIQYGKNQPYGPLQEVNAEAGYFEGRSDHWKLVKSMGGGAMYDMGVYPINAMRYATGLEPVAVEVATHSTNRPEIYTEVDETTDFTLSFPNGIIATGRTSFGMGINTLTVKCAKGWYELSPFQSYSGIQGKTSDGTILNESIPNQQARQMDNDALAILNDSKVLVPGEEGLNDIKIVEAVYKSAATGSRVLI